MISPGSSAVSNRPLKKSSAAIARLLVMMVAPSAERGGRIIGGRVVVGDRAADGAAVAHRRIADHAGELGERRDSACCTTGALATSAWRVMAPIDERIGRLGSMPARSVDPGEIDDRGGRGQPLLHRRQQRLAAGEQLGVLVLGEQAGAPGARVVGR